MLIAQCIKLAATVDNRNHQELTRFTRNTTGISDQLKTLPLQLPDANHSSQKGPGNAGSNQMYANVLYLQGYLTTRLCQRARGTDFKNQGDSS